MSEYVIYKILKYIKPNKVTTSEQLLKYHFFKSYGFDALNDSLSKLNRLGYISGKKESSIIYVNITPAGLNFIRDYHYCKQLKTIERIITFLAGILSGTILTYGIPFLLSLLNSQ